MKVCWFSGGVSSFIAGYLERDSIDEFIYCHIDNQHPDTLRFLRDCEKALGREITVIQSRYKSVENVIQQFGYITRPNVAVKCSTVLKGRVRKEWEVGKGHLEYVWGYDSGESHRADKTVAYNPKYHHIFPLIERNLNKQDCHGMLKELGIKRPAMYDLGYSNNNCIGCVKGGIGYWNKIRVDFPEVFNRMAERERVIGATCLNGIWLDELDPSRGRMSEEIMEECSILCQLNL